MYSTEEREGLGRGGGEGRKRARKKVKKRVGQWILTSRQKPRLTSGPTNEGVNPGSRRWTSEEKKEIPTTCVPKNVYSTSLSHCRFLFILLSLSAPWMKQNVPLYAIFPLLPINVRLGNGSSSRRNGSEGRSTCFTAHLFIYRTTAFGHLTLKPASSGVLTFGVARMPFWRQSLRLVLPPGVVCQMSSAGTHAHI